MFISASDISPHSEERAQIEEASVEMDESAATNHNDDSLLCLYHITVCFLSFAPGDCFCLIVTCAMLSY